jgi:homoserine dehydrogenase
LNGTTNFILTQMRLRDSSFQDSLQEAQLLGYAEADPVNDISGQDAFHKLMILSALAFGKQPNWDDVKIEGISDIPPHQVQEAINNGQIFRHIAEISRNPDGTLHASVKLKLIEYEHPLYAIEGVNNAIVIDTNYIGALTLVGPGAGKFPTAGVMVEDYAEIMGNQSRVLVTL